ncbi:MAG: 30S ribosomal protein S9 [Thermoprotei archaeon]|nr:MAG: 30S ribosomal protein S9 [Thermoprotei archaeon]
MARVVIASARRKTARARVVVKEGKGRVFVNGVPLEVLEPELVRLKIYEPIYLAGEEIISKVDIYAEARGGGVMGQASAIRTAIARALGGGTGSEALRELYYNYDRPLLVEHPRQKEPKKPGGRSARAKRQKSYR